MERTPRLKHVGLVAGALGVLSAVLVACGPLTASIAKQSGAGSSTPITPIGGVGNKPHVLTFSARIIPQAANPGDDTTDGAPGVTIGLTPTQVEAFKQTGKAEITLSSGILPEAIQARFQVSLTRQEVIESGLIDQPVATLKPKSENVWVLSISNELSASTTQLLKQNLVGVELFVTLQQ